MHIQNKTTYQVGMLPYIIVFPGNCQVEGSGVLVSIGKN